MGDWFGGSESKVVSAPTKTPQQSAFLNRLATMGYGQLGKGAPSYPGLMVAPMSGLEQQGMNLISQGSMLPNLGAGVIGQMVDPASNMQYWQQFFEPYQEQIANRFASGYGPDSQARSSGMMDVLGRGFAQMIVPQVMQQQQYGLGMIPEMAQLPGQLGFQQMAAGAIPREIQNQQYAAAYDKWMQSQGYNNPWLRLALQASGMPMFETGVTQGSSGMLSGLSQGAGTALGAAGLMALGI